ncbi:helix-turn-helix domain-containing protein [Cucumibacter marinus]|uniref:helix-turn-helix domain-containing protein n=1 Tax=Cucumibacter marinus TaxID=1121252 RepID=UPI000401A012|nr:helix-turn-helix domain-containing protein [Cucumibacter marinus]
MVAFHYEEFEPPAPLRPFLRATFFAEGQIHYPTDRILPNGLAVAIFNLSAPHLVGKRPDRSDWESFERDWVHGVQTTPMFNTPTGRTRVVGMLFDPVGLHALTGKDITHWTDLTVAAADILPPGFIEGMKSLLDSPGETATHQALHDLFAAHARLDQPGWVLDLAGDLRAKNGMVSLDAAYKGIGHSARHLNAVFKRMNGVSPKTLSCIYRLNALLGEIGATGAVNWAKLAHDYGFYDQSHFNREFRRFAGMTPRAYLEGRRTAYPEAGPGEGVSFAPEGEVS